MVYISGLQPWEVPAELLKVLCDVCHKDEHIHQYKIEELVAEMLADDITYKEIYELLLSAKIQVYG